MNTDPIRLLQPGRKLPGLTYGAPLLFFPCVFCRTVGLLPVSFFLLVINLFVREKALQIEEAMSSRND